MKKMTQFEKFGLIGAIIIACTFFYMKKIYEPQEKQFKKTVETLNKVAGELQSAQAVPPMPQVKGELEKARKRQEELNKELAGSMVRSGSSQEVTRLLTRIIEHVAESDLTILSQVPAGQKPDPMLQLTWSRYQLSLNGSFHGFLHLLTGLEAMPDAIRVDGVRLEKAEKNTLNITFDLLI